jgi:hypothetical protein
MKKFKFFSGAAGLVFSLSIYKNYMVSKNAVYPLVAFTSAHFCKAIPKATDTLSEAFAP